MPTQGECERGGRNYHNTHMLCTFANNHINNTHRYTDVTIAARNSYQHEINVSEEATQLTWQFRTTSGYDIAFGLYRVDASGKVDVSLYHNKCVEILVVGFTILTMARACRRRKLCPCASSKAFAE